MLYVLHIAANMLSPSFEIKKRLDENERMKKAKSLVFPQSFAPLLPFFDAVTLLSLAVAFSLPSQPLSDYCVHLLRGRRGRETKMWNCNKSPSGEKEASSVPLPLSPVIFSGDLYPSSPPFCNSPATGINLAATAFALYFVPGWKRDFNLVNVRQSAALDIQILSK